MTRNFFTTSLKTSEILEQKDVDTSLYEYDEEYDTITSVFHDLSYAFFDRGIHFVLKLNEKICPTTKWELSLFLDSFLDLVRFANDKDTNTYNLEFYEQTARYTFTFEKEEGLSYNLVFVDKDIPDSGSIQGQGTLLDLNLSLFTFYSRLIFLAEKICPSIGSNSFFVEWTNLVDKEFQTIY